MSLWVMTLLVTGPPDEVEVALERHRDHLRHLRREGKLRIAGEFANGDGLMEVYDVADRLEAERITRASPMVEEGLGAWILREWSETTTD